MENFDILQHTPVSNSAVGAEILLLDREDEARENLESLLNEAGFMVTATTDAERAMTLVKKKHFTLAILDIDTPSRKAGLDLATKVRAEAPATRLLMLTERKTFDRAVAAYRAGAAGIFPRGEDGLSDLFEAIVGQVEKDVGIEQRADLIKELLAFMEVFLRCLMQVGRRALRGEEKAGMREPIKGDTECIMVVVDDNPKTGPGLQKALGKDKFRVINCQTGGEALDVVSQHRFHIAMIKQNLPDLEGSMVAHSVLDMKTGATVLTFSERGEEPSSVTLVEEGKTTPLIPKLDKAEQLVTELQGLRKGIFARQKERIYLDTFRAEYYDLLKQYVSLRRKLTALIQDDQS